MQFFGLEDSNNTTRNGPLSDSRLGEGLRRMNAVFRAGFLAGLLLGLWTAVAAASCVTGSCHETLSNARYVHGPVAVESFGQQGCGLCHVSSGPICTNKTPGVYRLAKAREMLCTGCHDAGTGSRHTDSKGKCLSCHNPHGSEQNIHFLKNG